MPRRLDLIARGKMPRMKRKIRMPTMEEMPPHPLFLCPPTAAPEKVIEEKDPIEMVPEEEASVAHEVILVDSEPEMSQPRLYHAFKRDCEESPPRMMDDLDDDPNEGRSDMDEWFS
jgi:hypothetical protein